MRTIVLAALCAAILAAGITFQLMTLASRQRSAALEERRAGEIAALRSEIEVLQKAHALLAEELVKLQPKEDRGAATKPGELADSVSTPGAGETGAEGEKSETALARAEEQPDPASAAEAERESKLEEALERLFDPKITYAAKQHLWKQLGKDGLIDEAVAAFEARAEENSRDPDAQAELGHAYIQKLLTAGDVEKGMWSMKAHAAYDKALALDDHHWEARFSKAVTYSYAPPIFGLQAKAIGEFETLIGQQEARAPEKRFAETYVLLGNLYQNQGNTAKAQEVWRKGAELYPEVEALRERLKAPEEKP